MARADLVVALARAAAAGDQSRVRKVLEAIASEESEKQHHIVAEQLRDVIATTGRVNGPSQGASGDPGSTFVHQVVPERKLDDLLLSEVTLASCRELIEEQHRGELLRAYNLEPRHRVLLVGPPGNGKTSLAEALASELLAPLFVVRYEGIVASYLGETASRLQRLFDFVRTRRCVLFLDEFDTLAKERGDEHETGEIKRVVSSLLLQIDRLPSHVVVVTATNHPELLDRAVWRRFQVRLELPAPTRIQREEWFIRFGERMDIEMGFAPRTLADKLDGLSFAEIEEFSLDVLRRRVLTVGQADPRSIVRSVLDQWAARARVR